MNHTGRPQIGLRPVQEVKESTVEKILGDVLAEREFQRQKWGGDLDLQHTPNEWATILLVWLGKLASEIPPYKEHSDPLSREAYQKRLTQIAAICMAAKEADLRSR